MKKNMMLTIGILIAAILITGCRAQEETVYTEPAPVVTEGTVPTQPRETEDTMVFDVPESDVFSIETPFGDIQYPTKWEEVVLIDKAFESAGLIRFICKPSNMPVFDLVLGGTDANVLGFVNLDAQRIPIGVTFYPIDDDDLYADICHGMQEDINVILAYLDANYDFDLYTAEDTPEEKPEEHTEESAPVMEEASVFDISTSVATLSYPRKWKELVDVTVSEGMNVVVSFRVKNSNISLFDVILGESSDYLLGTFHIDGKEVSVRVRPYDLDRNDSNFSTYCGMQEDVNVIIAHLVSSYNLNISE